MRKYLFSFLLFLIKSTTGYFDADGYYISCEGYDVKLSCKYTNPPYTMITLDDVEYGSFVGICDEITTNCTSSIAFSQLIHACENKSSCTFLVLSTVYGGSYCVTGANNAIRVKYSCVAATSVAADLILDGWWSTWLPWSPCSATISGTTGTKSRNRTCTDPAPNNGFDCKGAGSEDASCTADETTTLVGTCCSCPSSADANITSEELQNKIAEMKNELTVNKHELSSSVRKKTSAADDRASSVAMGTVAVVFLTFFTVGIIGMDMKRILDASKTVLRSVMGWTTKKPK